MNPQNRSLLFAIALGLAMLTCAEDSEGESGNACLSPGEIEIGIVGKWTGQYLEYDKQTNSLSVVNSDTSTVTYQFLDDGTLKYPNDSASPAWHWDLLGRYVIMVRDDGNLRAVKKVEICGGILHLGEPEIFGDTDKSVRFGDSFVVLGKVE